MKIIVREFLTLLVDLDLDGNITIKDLVGIGMKKSALDLYENGYVEDFILLVYFNRDGKFSSVDLVLMIKK